MNHLVGHTNAEHYLVLENDDTEEQLKCEGCDLNVAKLDDALNHLKDLCKDFKIFNFEEKRVFLKERFRCPICIEDCFSKNSEVRFHILTHVNDIHNGVTQCLVCPRTDVFSTM